MKKYASLIFLVSIAIFAASFHLQRHFMISMDEYEQLVSGWLISEGLHPYKDFFSNHLPFPFYYSSVFAYFYKNVSNVTAITIFRLGLLIFYLANFVALYFLSKHKTTKLPLSIFIASLAIWFSVYHGNLLFSDTFLAIFLMGITWITIPIILKWENLTTQKFVYLAFISALVSWTTTIPPIPFLILLLLKTEKKKTLVIFTIFLYLLPSLFFILNSQFKNLIEQVFYQNLVYSTQTFPEKIENTNLLTQQAIKFIVNELYLFTHFKNPYEAFQFILNSAVSLFAVYLVIKQRYRDLLIFIFLFLTARSREFKIIVGKPFIFSFYPYLCFASSVLIMLANKFNLARLGLFFYIIFSIVQVKPIISQSLKPGYNFHVFFQDRVNEAEKIKQLTTPHEKILVYPNDIDIYFFARRFPADYFTFYFPWIDVMEKYQKIRQETINNKDFSVMYIGDITVSPKDIPFYSKYKEELIKGFINLPQPNGNPSHIWVKGK